MASIVRGRPDRTEASVIWSYLTLVSPILALPTIAAALYARALRRADQPPGRRGMGSRHTL
jgi:hypothetical protein